MVVTGMLLVPIGLLAGFWITRTREPDPALVSLRKAQADLEGAVNVGVNYADFGHNLQALSSAVIVARQSGIAPTLIGPYDRALEMYRDSYQLWQLKFECPSAFNDAYPACSVAKQIGVLADKYGLPFNPKAPLSSEKEEFARKLAAMDRYAPTLSQDRMKEIRERHLRDIEKQYAEQQATREIYNTLLTTIWQKAAAAPRQPS